MIKGTFLHTVQYGTEFYIILCVLSCFFMFVPVPGINESGCQTVPAPHRLLALTTNMLARLSRAAGARTGVARALSSFRASPSARSDQFNKHRHTDDNNDETPFDFSEENYRKVDTILGKYPENYKQS